MKKTTLTISLALAGLIGFGAMALAPIIDAASPPHTVKVTNGTVTRIEPLAGTITSTSEASVSYSGPKLPSRPFRPPWANQLSADKSWRK